MNTLLHAYQYWTYEKNNFNVFSTIEQDESKLASKSSKESKFEDFINSYEFDNLINLVTVINWIFIIIRVVGFDESTGFIYNETFHTNCTARTILTQNIRPDIENILGLLA